MDPGAYRGPFPFMVRLLFVRPGSKFCTVFYQPGFFGEPGHRRIRQRVGVEFVDFSAGIILQKARDFFCVVAVVSYDQAGMTIHPRCDQRNAELIRNGPKKELG